MLSATLTNFVIATNEFRGAGAAERTEYHNIVALDACNNSKGDRTVEEWRGRMDQAGGIGQRASIYVGRSIFTSSEAEAARELPRIRATVAAWDAADKRFWPVVSKPHTHDHPRWSARHMVSTGRTSWDVCPPGCATPARWQPRP